MKRYFALVPLVWLALVAGVHAQGLDDQYVQIFNLIQEADTLRTAEPAKALRKYYEAQTALQRLQKGNPGWNPTVLNFRLNYVAGKIAELGAGAPATTPPSADQTNRPPAVPATAPTLPPAATNELQVQLISLQEQVRQLQADRVLTEAKLKEALAAQPAESDPRELARAEDKIKTLQKENELLKAGLEAEKSKPKTSADAKALEQAQQALAEANHKTVEQKELIMKLSAEREALQARLKSSPDTAVLQAENELLKKRLAAAGSPAAAPPQGGAPASQTADAQAQIAALQSDKELLRLEKIALENRVRQLTASTSPAAPTPAATPPPAPAGSDQARVRQLERERDDLQKRLEAANKAAAGRKGKSAAAQSQNLELQLAAARARLEVLEARQVPYSAEELALLKRPDTTLAPPQSKTPKKKELPAGSAKLVAEAQTAFAARQYDKAEAAYKEVVRLEPSNVPALANLAAIQVEAGNLEAANANINSALAGDPDDTFSLYILGILRFRQAKYDESFDALSRAAKIEPENPEIQNYLGLALSEKGMRGPAETALRKAIQLQPNYGSAHYNLAVVYLTQQPPATELARWHYQKALAVGQPRNAEFERKLEAK